jgi:hypothetical protein
MLVFFLVFCVVFLSLICLSSSSFLLVFVIFLVCLRHLSCLSSSFFLLVFVICLVWPMFLFAPWIVYSGLPFGFL